jgi:hypothetical protein
MDTRFLWTRRPWKRCDFLTSLGSVTDTYQYDVFGNLIGSAGTTPNSYFYTGERLDFSLGLYEGALRVRVATQLLRVATRTGCEEMVGRTQFIATTCSCHTDSLLPPSHGRFWTRDPEEGLLSRPLSLHPYIFAWQNPVNLTDPTGRAVLAESQQQVKVQTVSIPGTIALVAAIVCVFELTASSLEAELENPRRPTL